MKLSVKLFFYMLILVTISSCSSEQSLEVSVFETSKSGHQLTSINSFYEKEDREDLMSISDGITGSKGNVHLSIGKPMVFESDSYEEIAGLITEKIKTSYKNHSTNIAACVMQGIKIPTHNFTEDEIDEAMVYLNQRMHLIPEEMHPYLLQQYSNSVL